MKLKVHWDKTKSVEPIPSWLVVQMYDSGMISLETAQKLYGIALKEKIWVWEEMSKEELDGFFRA